MALIYVQVEMGVDLTDRFGDRVRLDETPRGVFLPVEADTYRRNAWMGLFRRFLVPRRRFGRAVLVDEIWRREHETDRGDRIPDPTPEVTKRHGCGCGGA